MSVKQILSSIETMPIEEIVNTEFKNQIYSQKSSLSKTDIKFLSKKLVDFKTSNPEYILKCIFLFSFWDPNLAIETARKKGIFRYKAWGLKTNHALYILTEIERFKDFFGFSSDNIKYICSKINLSWLFDYYQKSERKIISFIQEHYANRARIKDGEVVFEEALFKELLAFSDILFHQLNRENEYHNKNELDGYSPEEITEAISYIIFLYDEIVGVSTIKNPFVVPDFVLSKELKNILLISCKALQLQEWELCVDYFGFEVRRTDRTYNIATKDDIFEKSVRLGYIRTMMQGAIFYSKGFDSQKDTPGLIEMSEYFNQSDISCISATGKGLLSRYHFNLPEPLLKYFTSKTLFKEELIEAAHFAHEMIMPLDDLLAKKITENCTIHDVILFKRFFVILDLIAENQLFSQKSTNKILASILPSFNRNKLANILSTFVGDISKACELLNLFTYEKNVKLDLQYTPFLSSGESIYIPIALVAKSNFLRNCIAYSYLIKNEIVNQSDEEHLVLECKRVFEEKHSEYSIFTNRKFHYQNQDGEIDVLAISDDKIYIIECKAPLEPTGNFELRASFDHINKASKQLDNCKKAFSDEAFLKTYLKSIGVEYKSRNVHTCVIMGNRFFNGYIISYHPVRYIRELDMILNNGHIYSEIGKWRVWKETDFCDSDLIKFFSHQYEISYANFNAMKPWNDILLIDGKKIIFNTYIFDIFEAIKQYDSLFTVEERNEEKYQQIIKRFAEVDE